MSGVFSPGRAKIKERTLRTDKWWLEPAITFGVLFSFIIYATFRAFENANYYKDHLISPFLFSLFIASLCSRSNYFRIYSSERRNFQLCTFTSANYFDLPTWFPYDLLLLPQGLLPLILDVTTSLRSCRTTH